VDYQHGRAARPPAGSLVGYRRGTVVDPVPDGTCDITSQVALDACAAAGLVAGGAWTVLTDQRSALRALLGPQPAPAYDVAGRDPAAYLAALSRASQAAELMRADGLGGFGWLAQGVGLAAPAVLTPGEEQARPRRASDAGRG
jgi:hypothetical protein